MGGGSSVQHRKLVLPPQESYIENRRSLAEQLYEFSVHRGHNVFVKYLERRLTESSNHMNVIWTVISYHVFLKGVRQFAAALRHVAGINRGDRVAICCPLSWEWLTAFFGCQFVGAAAVIGPYSTEEEITEFVVWTQVKCLVVNDSMVESLRMRFEEHWNRYASERIPLGSVVIIPASLRSFLVKGAAFDEENQEHARIVAYPDDVAVIFRTSGSCGTKRLVAHSQKTLVNYGDFFAVNFGGLGLDPEEPTLLVGSNTPIALQAISSIIAALFSGLTLVFSPEGMFMDYCKIARPRMLILDCQAMLPLWEMCMHSIVNSAVARKGLEAAIQCHRDAISLEDHRECALSPMARAFDAKYAVEMRKKLGGKVGALIVQGGMVSKDVVDFFWAVGIPVFESYTLSEGLMVACNTPSFLKIGTHGTVCPGYDLLIDPDTKCISIRSPFLCLGYVTDEVVASVTDAKGWYNTGDAGQWIATAQKEGRGNWWFVEVLGRMSDKIVMQPSGLIVFPNALEAQLATCIGVRDVLITGNGHEFLIAIVEPVFETKGRPKEELQRHLVQIRNALIKSANDAGVDHSTRPRKVVLIRNGFTVENGLRTDARRVKRQEVEKKYKRLIDKAYEARQLRSTANGFELFDTELLEDVETLIDQAMCTVVGLSPDASRPESVISHSIAGFDPQKLKNESPGGTNEDPMEKYMHEIEEEEKNGKL